MERQDSKLSCRGWLDLGVLFYVILVLWFADIVINRSLNSPHSPGEVLAL